jgi:hypothetical protein
MPLDSKRVQAEESSFTDEDSVETEADRTVFVWLPPDPPAARERPAPAIDGYEVLGELGRGRRVE